MKNKKFHGKGVYESKKYRFEGIWKNGCINGPGVCYCIDGTISKGIFHKNRKRFGKG